MIDPADLELTHRAIRELAERVDRIEAWIMQRQGSVVLGTLEQPDAPLQFVRGKPNAPPHDEPEYIEPAKEA